MRRKFLYVLNYAFIIIVFLFLVGECKQETRQTQNLTPTKEPKPRRLAKTVTDTRIIAGKVSHYTLHSVDLYIEIEDKNGLVGCWITPRSDLVSILPRMIHTPKSLCEWVEVHERGKYCCGTIGFKDGVVTSAVFVIDAPMPPEIRPEPEPEPDQ